MVDTALVIAGRLAIVSDRNHGKDNDKSAENDCTAHPEAITVVAVWTGGADCKVKERKAISKEENRP